MSDCPIQEFYSTIVKGCLDCPNSIQDCDNEGYDDAYLCRKFCTGRSQRSLGNQVLSDGGAIGSSTATVIGTWVGISALFVLVVIVGVTIYYRYFRQPRTQAPRDVEHLQMDEEPLEDEDDPESDAEDSENLRDFESNGLEVSGNVSTVTENGDEDLDEESSNQSQTISDGIPKSMDKSLESVFSYPVEGVVA